MPTLLIIEDDPAIVMGLKDAFDAMALAEKADCIILDVMLPSMNGRDVCRAVRAQGIGTPILMLTSKSEESDIVLGLEIGADDYLTKPFRLAELIARVRALLRRKQALASSTTARLEFGDVVVDFDKLEATRGGSPIKMSVREFEVLKYLALREGTIVTREMLLDDVWGYDVFPTTRTIDNYILMLRKKLERDPSAPEHLLTVHTLGYRFIRTAGSA
jgi:DNA-binding response OmpR family regulator